MQTSDILIATRELFSNPMRWTQGAYVRPLAPGYNAYCFAGGLSKASGGWGEEGCKRYIKTVIRMRWPDYPVCIESWNDSRMRQHADILAVLDVAIELAQCDEELLGRKKQHEITATAEEMQAAAEAIAEELYVGA